MSVHVFNDFYIIFFLQHTIKCIAGIIYILGFFFFHLRLASCSFGLKQECVPSLCEDSQGQEKKKLVDLL